MRRCKMRKSITISGSIQDYVTAAAKDVSAIFSDINASHHKDNDALANAKDVTRVRRNGKPSRRIDKDGFDSRWRHSESSQCFFATSAYSLQGDDDKYLSPLGGDYRSTKILNSGLKRSQAVRPSPQEALALCSSSPCSFPPAEPRVRAATITHLHSPQCDLLRAYTEALNFHEELKKEYDAIKRLFILHRYGRLRRLIHGATIETHLHKLQAATLCQCLCGARQDLLVVQSRLMNTVRPVFHKISACFKSAAALIVPSLLIGSNPTLSSPASQPSLMSCTDIPGVHEWHRSRLVLLRRHLERLKRQSLCTQRTTLPTTKYRAMKSSLKQVLDARMVR